MAYHRWRKKLSISAATTNIATAVTATGATLNGTVNANGASTAVTFEYGFTTAYGRMVTAAQSPISGTTATPVSAVLADLTPNSTYHFRVDAANVLVGTVNGADQTFTTGKLAPAASTHTATAITTTGATLNAMVNAENDSTAVTFHYGPTASYGSTVLRLTQSGHRRSGYTQSASFFPA